tara:strand:+ start:15 stop:161 length:147 start_codon:yes stop_codon:yes gene_type:complete
MILEDTFRFKLFFSNCESHHLVIETEDPEKIKKLKDMGFRELEDEAIE